MAHACSDGLATMDGSRWLRRARPCPRRITRLGAHHRVAAHAARAGGSGEEELLRRIHPGQPLCDRCIVASGKSRRRPWSLARRIPGLQVFVGGTGLSRGAHGRHAAAPDSRPARGAVAACPEPEQAGHANAEAASGDDGGRRPTLHARGARRRGELGSSRWAAGAGRCPHQRCLVDHYVHYHHHLFVGRICTFRTRGEPAQRRRWIQRGACYVDDAAWSTGVDGLC